MHFKKQNRVVLAVSIMIAFLMGGCEEKYMPEDCKEAVSIGYETLRADYPKIEKGRKIGKAAKIYNYQDGEILLINEQNRGIHVVNNHIKRSISKGDLFINIPGNVDMAVKDGYLYADSFTDLLVLDIRDINDIKLVSRKESIFPENFYQLQRPDKENKHCYNNYNNEYTGKFIIDYK